MAKFIAGKTYEWYQREYGEIKVLRRTDKMITVTNGGSTWRMKIRIDDKGNEYVVDSSVPKKWQDAFTCSAEWESEKGEKNGKQS